MQTYKLISSDLDTTLLSSDMTLSKENEEAIHLLSQKDILFVPNSGRTLSEFAPQILNHPDIRYLIYSDGAAIYDRVTGKVSGAYLKEDVYQKLLSILGEYKSYLSVRHNGASYVDAELFTEEKMIYHRVGKYYRDFLFATNHPTKDFGRFCKELSEVEMICAFFHDDEELSECSDRIRSLGDTMVVSSMANNIEILSDRAGKGNAMLRLAKSLGIKQAETIAVGDSTNDTDMILKAGLGLAVSNAWQELKESADLVLPCSNDEHVAKYLLESYFE